LQLGLIQALGGSLQQSKVWGKKDFKPIYNDSVILMTECKGNFIGFGEHPFDTNDWAVQSGTEVIEITVGTLKWKKPNET
jgi:hypothetical protein